MIFNQDALYNTVEGFVEK